MVQGVFCTVWILGGYRQIMWVALWNSTGCDSSNSHIPLVVSYPEHYRKSQNLFGESVVGIVFV